MQYLYINDPEVFTVTLHFNISKFSFHILCWQACLCVNLFTKINPFSEKLLFFFLFLDIMVTMGFARDEINDALINQKYDEIMATYILLGRKPPEVSSLPF